LLQMLAIACLTLHHYSYDLTDIPTLMLCSGTYVGYVVVLSGEIVGEMLFAPLDLVQDMYFGILGVGLYSVSGGMVLAARTHDPSYPRTGNHTAALVAAALALVNAFVMLFDLSLAYLDSEEFDDEASEVVSAAADPYVEAWWSGAGGVLFGACGALTLHSWYDVPPCARRTFAQAAAACAQAAAVLMAVDSILSLCSAHKDTASTRTKSHKATNA
ncbi:hypothetical protein RR46_14269, partial [Papilio xuthus]